MQEVIVTGSPHWSTYLAKALRNEGVEATHAHYKPRSLSKALSRSASRVLAVGLGGKLTPQTTVIWGTLFAFWFLKRRQLHIYLYWIGTDVHVARQKGVNRLLLSLWDAMRIQHICGAPWFVSELREAGLNAREVLFPYDTSDAAAQPLGPRRDRLQVLTYLRGASWDNLHGSRILELASKCPDIDWTIIGMTKEECAVQEVSQNVTFRGWVSDPLKWLAGCDVFIRLVDHDAYSGMVRDAQAMGKVVLYSMPVPGVIPIAGMNDEEIISTLDGVKRPSNLNVQPVDLPPYREQIAKLRDLVTGRL